MPFYALLDARTPIDVNAPTPDDHIVCFICRKLLTRLSTPLPTPPSSSERSRRPTDQLAFTVTCSLTLSIPYLILASVNVYYVLLFSRLFSSAFLSSI
jgi:hypothetical protein